MGGTKIEIDKKTTQKGNTQARIATAVTTSAMSLTLLSTMQNPLQAQDLREQRRIDPAAKAELTKEQVANKFLDFGYNYCDAKVLAKYWKQRDPYDAKITMGQKLWNLSADDSDQIVRDARAEALKKSDKNLPAYFDDGGYTYDDAKLLAGYWGSEDTRESKMTMSRLLIGDHDKVIKAALNSATRL